jgi:hypothetical protein
MSDRNPLLMAGKILPAFLLLGVMMMKQGQVSAFSASKMAIGRANIPTTQSTIYRYMAQDDDARLEPLGEVDYEELEDDDVVSPAPPKSIPAVDAQLSQDLKDTERRINLYAAEIEMMREQLSLKNDELMEERNTFREEKDKLMELIADLSKNLALRYEELESRQELVSGFEEREKDLKEQIEGLSKQTTEEKEAADEVPKVQRKVLVQGQGQMAQQPKTRTRAPFRNLSSTPTLHGNDFGIIFLE